ncbi:MAG TPA: hypothetical protein DIT67_06760 [Octadecabacter sp.]|nr:hypothetical protein [Octadecabacter sp.]
MQAINHAAAALILKRKFPSTPLLGLILATEAVEYLWVGLNLIGIEQTIIADPMRSVADVHLAHMPFSHSVATSVIIAALVGLLVLWRGGKAWTAIALALSLAVFSHIVLDLLVHARDIVIVPFLGTEKYGTGLYSNVPLVALGLETLFGVFCWWIYRGSWQLLGLIIALALTSIPLYSAAINVGEAALSGQSTVFALVILVQMLATSCLVWLFARQKPTSQNPINGSRNAQRLTT